jgi:integrase
MAWQRNYVTLRSGDRIRYAFFSHPQSPSYCVRFRGKDGKYVRLSTGQVKKPAAIEEAHRLVRERYEEIAPSSDVVTWSVAAQKLKVAMVADNKRPGTIRSYEETLRRLMEVFPLAKGPADVTDYMANDFKAKYASGTFSRKPQKKDQQVPVYGRSTKSLDSRIRTLKAVFGWFKQLRLVDANPFANVEQPELDRPEVKYVRQDDLDHFLGWLEGRYPNWRMPHLFFAVKALTACRLGDICALRSGQLLEGRLVFEASQTKNRSERYALLPTAVYAELDAYKGKEFLWERYPVELGRYTKSVTRHKVLPTFSPDRLSMWIRAVMRDYQNQTGKDLSSHDFRKAAFTRAAEADIHPKRAAVAFDVTPETMLKYYTATEKKRTADEVLGSLQNSLLPKHFQKLTQNSHSQPSTQTVN